MDPSVSKSASDEYQLQHQVPRHHNVIGSGGLSVCIKWSHPPYRFVLSCTPANSVLIYKLLLNLTNISTTILLIAIPVNSGRTFTIETTINTVANSNGGITLNAIAMFNSVTGVALDSAGVK